MLRPTLCLLVVALAMVLNGGSPPKAVANVAPNVLFILTEDQGNHLGFVGTPGIRTPNMDALARRGVYFHNAFVAYPVCSASKAAIYTGLHNHTNGLMGNTANNFKPASALRPEDRRGIYARNQIDAKYPTLVELLHAAGYFTGVSGKLHVAPNEKFPYDMFLGKGSVDPVALFLKRAKESGKPWFMLHNISTPHRPYPNSDTQPIGVNPDEVRLPLFLPDTPVIRQDWAEYLAAIERTDVQVGRAVQALEESGEAANTIVLFMGDHGPCFQRGKMNLHDFGLRVPLAICGPGIVSGKMSKAMVSEVDLLPTLLYLMEIDHPPVHGVSHHKVLSELDYDEGREYVFAEISDDGPLPNDGMQERSVCDGRFHLIYRENLDKRRQVNADLRDWKAWRNRAYAETVKQRSRFPRQYEMLRQMDPQRLGGKVPRFELYDLKNDPEELQDLSSSEDHVEHVKRLYPVLRNWGESTGDTSVRYDAQL